LVARGIGSLYKIEQILNVVRYLELLREELFTTFIEFNFDLGEVISQQDNAFAHITILCHKVASSITRPQSY
jgi:hypothetical protein